MKSSSGSSIVRISLTLNQTNDVWHDIFFMYSFLCWCERQVITPVPCGQMKRGSWTIWPLSVNLEEETHAHHWLNLRVEDGRLFDGDQRVTDRGEEGEAKEGGQVASNATGNRHSRKRWRCVVELQRASGCCSRSLWKVRARMRAPAVLIVGSAFSPSPTSDCYFNTD